MNIFSGARRVALVVGVVYVVVVAVMSLDVLKPLSVRVDIVGPTHPPSLSDGATFDFCGGNHLYKQTSVSIDGHATSVIVCFITDSASTDNEKGKDDWMRSMPTPKGEAGFDFALVEPFSDSLYLPPDPKNRLSEYLAHREATKIYIRGRVAEVEDSLSTGELGKQAARRLGAERSSLRLEYAKVLGVFAGGGLILWWALVWTIGWIVRGFLGIPRGRDVR